MVRQYYEQGTHVVIVDVGDSYLVYVFNSRESIEMMVSITHIQKKILFRLIHFTSKMAFIP